MKPMARRRALRGLAARTAGPDRRPRMAQQGRVHSRARRAHPPLVRRVLAGARRICRAGRAGAAAAGATLAFDIGAGTGVLSAVLAHRGLRRVVATDMDERALGCARANIERLGLSAQVEIVKADLFPRPRRPGGLQSALAAGQAEFRDRIRDLRSGQPHAARLPGGLKAHLAPGGEGWLILSDLAEHLGLRSREQLLGWIARPAWSRGPPRRAPDPPERPATGRPAAAARMAEVTSLWRLRSAENDLHLHPAARSSTIALRRGVEQSGSSSGS
jgi:SAM-dependent methyltransferase